MPEYIYSPLSHGSIRLLQLLPRREDPKNIRCKIFEYSLRNLDSPSHLYEALSYVWGSEDQPESIIIADQPFKVTRNLYKALLHLQDHGISRIIWIDAVCINQRDEKEKENQIQFMAEIYSKANSVIVWLCEAQDNSQLALDRICLAGEKSMKNLSHTTSIQQPILNILQRQWFHRIWVREQSSVF